MKNTPTTIETWMFKKSGETLALLFSLSLVVILMYFLYELNFWLLIGYLFVNLIYIKLRQAQLLGSALRVQPTQFPELYNALLTFAKKLETPKVNMYIVQDPNPNAYTFGFGTASIVLASSLVENLTQKELEFVIAHELGHVKAGHNIILSLLSPLDQGFFYSNLLFSFWQRAAEYTSDRCAIALTGDIDSGISALVKISAGLKIMNGFNLDAYREQLLKADSSSVSFGEMLLSHPVTSNRIREMIIYKKESFVKVVS
jgi:Zn-dependent protease with chaperone function